MLTKENFQPFARLKKRTVTLPDLGGEVTVRELSAGEFLEFGQKSASASSVADKSGLILWLFARSIVGQDGKRLFQDDEAAVLGDSLTRGDFEKVQAAVFDLNGMAQETVEKN
jgi:hypothetical protein